MEEKYLIFWGLNKDASPFFESDLTIKDQSSEPVNPADERVIKFDDEASAQRHLELNYPDPRHGEILSYEECEDIYNEYVNK